MGKKSENGFRSRTSAQRVLLGTFCAVMVVMIVGCQTTDGRRKSCLFNQSCGSDIEERAQSNDVKTTTTTPPKPPEIEQPQTLSLDANDATNATSQSNAVANVTPAPSGTQFYQHTDESTSRAPQPSDVANDFFNSNANSAPPVEAPPALAQPSYPQRPLFQSYGPALPNQNNETAKNDTKDGVGFASDAQDYSAQLPAEIKAAASLFQFEETLPPYAPLPSELNANPASANPQNSSEPIPPVESTTVAPEATANAAALQLRNTTILSEMVAPKRIYVQETRAAANNPETQNAPSTYVVAYPTQNPAPAPTMQSNLQPSQNFPGQFVGGVIDGSRPRARQM